MTKIHNGQTFLFGEAVPELKRGALVFDYFAGAGGASTGIEQALGRSPDVAINHCANAVACHKLNHPNTDHYQVDVWDVDPKRHLPPGDVEMAWFSPTCTHFSRAKGGKPVNKKIRGLAWVVVRVARERKPRVVFLENVTEFTTWGPLDADGMPVKAKAGQTFRAFVRKLERLGYAVEHRVLNAADYGAPTLRKRLVMIARRDGKPIVWPDATHGPGRAKPYRTAAECIDWTIPVPSIFDRPRPLADATCKRLADGIMRYVVNAQRPFIAPVGDGFLAHTMVQTGYGEHAGQRPRSLDLAAPLGTIVTTGKHALVAVWLAKHYGGVVGHSVERPLGTITTVDHHSVVACHLKKVGEKNEFDSSHEGSGGDGSPCRGPSRSRLEHGFRQEEVRDSEAETKASGGSAEERIPGRSSSSHGEAVPGASASPRVDRSPGRHSGENGHQSHRLEQGEQQPGQPGRGDKVGEHSPRLRDGTSRENGHGVGHVSSGCGPSEERQELFPDSKSPGSFTDNRVSRGESVYAFLTKFYSAAGNNQSLGTPMHTIVTKDRFGLVTVLIDGETYAIADIGLRMLTPRELARAQGFEDSFQLVGTQTEQVARIGNSVSPPMARAVVAANI